MDIVSWETPPPATRGPNRTAAPEAELLRTRPNEWARIFEFEKPETAGVTARTIKKGLRSGFGPEGDFEAVSRKIDGKGVVYARFVGSTD